MSSLCNYYTICLKKITLNNSIKDSKLHVYENSCFLSVIKSDPTLVILYL